MDIEKRHPYYKENIGLWKYLNASYQGGKEYRSPKFRMLRKYLDEEGSKSSAYEKRLEYTALDNLVKLTIDTYRSYLFRTTPIRTFGNQADNILVNRFQYDVDLEGKDLNDFMRSANDLAMVYGHVWIMVTKGFKEGVITLQQEIDADIRPYAKLFTPENVIDWAYEKQANGRNELVRLVTCEEYDEDAYQYIVWEKTIITTYKVTEDNGKEVITMSEMQLNPLNEVPFILLCANDSDDAGIGKSDIEDVSKAQQAIFNLLSEAEQGIRISNHPTLAKTRDTSATAGAGSIIDLDPNLDPNLKPYLLEPSGTNISSIVEMINIHVESVLRMTHLGAIMAAKGLTAKSGVALATEFEMLNVRLGDKAARLEQAEYKMWEFFWKWANITQPTEFNVEYHKRFDLRDEAADLALYSSALQLPIKSSTYQRELQKQIAKLVIKNGDAIDDIMAELDAETFDIGDNDASQNGLQ